jgi:hypothetical protein
MYDKKLVEKVPRLISVVLALVSYRKWAGKSKFKRGEVIGQS